MCDGHFTRIHPSPKERKNWDKRGEGEGGANPCNCNAWPTAARKNLYLLVVLFMGGPFAHLTNTPPPAATDFSVTSMGWVGR